MDYPSPAKGGLAYNLFREAKALRNLVLPMLVSIISPTVPIIPGNGYTGIPGASFHFSDRLYCIVTIACSTSYGNILNGMPKHRFFQTILSLCYFYTN